MSDWIANSKSIEVSLVGKDTKKALESAIKRLVSERKAEYWYAEPYEGEDGELEREVTIYYRSIDKYHMLVKGRLSISANFSATSEDEAKQMFLDALQHVKISNGSNHVMNISTEIDKIDVE